MSKTMCDASGNPLSVGMAVLWRPSDDRSFRPGWVRDVSDFAGAPAARIDDGAEWDTDRTGRTWSVTEWIADPKQIRPREQPAPDPRLAKLARLTRILEVERGTPRSVEGWTYGGSWCRSKDGLVLQRKHIRPLARRRARPDVWVIRGIRRTDPRYREWDFALQAMQDLDAEEAPRG